MSARIFSLPAISNDDARVLILGSMPGRESLRQQQYYAHLRNQFWKIMYALFHEPYDQPDYPQKIKWLTMHRLALWDSIHYCVRAGSLDSAIRDEEPNDIPGLLASCPGIRAIAFNGSKSFAVFRRCFRSSVPADVDLLPMPSTSPTPSRYPKTLAEKIKDWSRIKAYLS